MGFDLINSYKLDKSNNKRIELFFNDVPMVKTKSIKSNVKSKNNDFIGIIEIPKIYLKGGFVHPLSIHNNINENITILKPFMLPNENNSTFILAAHSGNSHVSYFKNLYKLDIDDIVYIYFNNKRYEYKIVKYYDESKNGTITIKDNTNIKKLVLTTCSSFDKQLIYIAHLIRVSYKK